MSPFARPGVRVAAALITLLVSVLGAGVATSAPPLAPAQALPSPLRFASFLDLECFPTPPYQPPTVTITTRHLNPVLAHLPTETTILGPRQQLCVPVAKNNTLPPPDVLPFIRYVDLACYRIQGQTVNQQLRLNHLNPLFTSLPPHTVTILNPVQLCVPVMKNGVAPPPEIRRLVSFIDLKCYAETPPTPLNRTVTLTHLNPVLGQLPPANAGITTNRQLCVPVQKNNQPIPPEILHIIRWIDLEKYDITTPPLPAPVNLTLNHLNPLLAGLPTEPVTLTQARQLMLPVAKNGLIPPTT
jgi:hypothetical protein